MDDEVVQPVEEEVTPATEQEEAPKEEEPATSKRGRKKKEIPSDEPVVEDSVTEKEVFPLLYIEGRAVTSTSYADGRYYLTDNKGVSYVLPKQEYDHKVQRDNFPR